VTTSHKRRIVNIETKVHKRSDADALYYYASRDESLEDAVAGADRTGKSLILWPELTIAEWQALNGPRTMPSLAIRSGMMTADLVLSVT
jgi:hypothetical protein